MSFRLTPPAYADIFDIWSYIAADSPEAADRVEKAIYDACELLSKQPVLGQFRRELTELPLRFWTVQRFSNYIIVYDPEATPLQIIRVLHAKRNIKLALESLQ